MCEEGNLLNAMSDTGEAKDAQCSLLKNVFCLEKWLDQFASQLSSQPFWVSRVGSLEKEEYRSLLCPGDANIAIY